MTRWEIIDVIRTLSTQAAKQKADTTGGLVDFVAKMFLSFHSHPTSPSTVNSLLLGLGRFARGNLRVNMADIQNRFRQHCQMVFDQQNT